VYIVVDVGLTTAEVPVRAPGFHVYVEAPLAVSVAEDPIQIAVGVLTIFRVGLALTAIATVLLLLQDPVIPRTV
jgi:hypothetical protein